jgi:hypothetical protein
MARSSLGKPKIAGLLVEKRDVMVSHHTRDDLTDVEQLQHLFLDLCVLVRCMHRRDEEERTIETFFDIVFAIVNEPAARPLPPVRPRGAADRV